MYISISRSSPLTNHRPISGALIDRLSEKYSYMPDIRMRLESLPEVKRGRNVGALPASTPHENAVAFAKLNEMDVYVGYLIISDPNGGLQIVTHSFCVENDLVIEPTKGIDWTPATRYIGRLVDPVQYRNFEYLNRFNRLFI